MQLNSKVARAKSDADIRFNKLTQDLQVIQSNLKDQSVSFIELAGVIAMVVENLSMQIEAELQDLTDRQSIALYAGHHRETRVDNTVTTEKLRERQMTKKASIFSPLSMSPRA